MAEQKWTAAIRPELHPAAQELVAAYESVPGALTYPGAMPEALARVLDHIWAKSDGYPEHWLADLAALLRGEQP